MATIKSPSPWLMPVRTPLWVSMSPALADSPGTAAVFILSPSVPVNAGYTCTFTYGAETITLACVSGVSESNLLPRTFLGAGYDAAQTAINIANACRRDYTLNRDFIITTDGLFIRFTQRTLHPSGSSTPNSAFNFGGITCSPGSWISGAVETMGSEASAIPNHSMRVALYLENEAGTAFERLPERSCAIVTGQAPAIDIAGALKGNLTPGLPVFGTAFAYLHGIPVPGVARRFYAEVYEFSGDPAAPGNVQRLGSETDPLIAWHAGFQQQDPAAAASFVQQLQYTTHRRQFLTYMGKEQPTRVSKGQYHYLSHYNWAQLSGELPELEAQVLCTDGTVSAWVARYAQIAQYVRRTVTIWACGYDHLQLDALLPAGKVASGYRVRLRAATSALALTEEKEFTLVPEDYQEQHLLFLNSVGGYDPVRSTGAWVESGQAETQVVERPALISDYANKEASRVSAVPRGVQRVITVRTGHLPLREHRCVVDILTSPDIRRVDRVRGRYERVYIAKSKEVRLEERGADDEHLYALELDLHIGHPEHVVTGTGYYLAPNAPTDGGGETPVE